MQDHLGNTRVVLNQQGEAIQTNSYYPFGMNIESLTWQQETPTPLNPKNLYTYNGKELQEDFNLNWHDYGFRMYDAQIGRWHVIDPMAESHYDYTEYAYVYNNPMIFIDPLGRDTILSDAFRNDANLMKAWNTMKQSENFMDFANKFTGEDAIGNLIIGIEDKALGRSKLQIGGDNPATMGFINDKTITAESNLEMTILISPLVRHHNEEDLLQTFAHETGVHAMDDIFWFEKWKSGEITKDKFAEIIDQNSNSHIQHKLFVHDVAPGFNLLQKDITNGMLKGGKSLERYKNAVEEDKNYLKETMHLK